VRHQRGTAITEKGHRDACGRQQANHHPGVDESISGIAGGDPPGQISSGQVRRLPRNGQPAANDHQEEEKHTHCSDQSVFLADHGEDKIVVGFGQKEVLLMAAADALADQPALRQGDERLLEMGVHLAARAVEVIGDPPDHVGINADIEQGHTEGAQACDNRIAEPYLRQKEHGEGDEQRQGCSTHIMLQGDRPGDRQCETEKDGVAVHIIQLFTPEVELTG